MALVVKDRVQETTTTVGTGTVTLSGAVLGFQTFAIIGDGNTTYYTIADPTTGDYEVGIGTYTSSGTTLSRTTVLESSNSGSLVSFAAGTKNVFCTYPAERAVYLDTAGSAVTVLDIGTLGASTANITTANITSGTISTTPTSNTDIVNKQYADAIASGIHFHEAVELATTAVLPANTYNNGTSGVGATLTANANGALSVDSTLTVVNNRVLVKNEVTQANNGVYVVTQVGTAGTPYILTRATDFDTVGTGVDQIDEGDFFLVTGGVANINTAWVQQTAPPITVGTTALVFQQFAAPITYTAGTGLNESPAFTFNIASTGTAGTYGGAASVPVFTTNAQGQVTSVTPTGIAIASGAVSGLAASATTDTTNASNISSGTLGTSRLSGSYTGITGTGALAAGSLATGFTAVSAPLGGTGQTSYAVGDLLYASTTTALSKLADVAVGNALISGGVAAAPSYGKIGLATHVSGTLPIANGGTGTTSTTFANLTTNVTGTLPVANGGTGVTASTGTGSVVLSTSPTLVTPALGTPASGVVTNLTGTASININGTVGATTPAAGTFTSLSDSGNLTFTGTGNRITGDWSTATITNRPAFQTSVVNGNTSPFVLPNGTGNLSQWIVSNNSDPTNAGLTRLYVSTTESSLQAGITGTGTYLPLTFYTNGSERVRIDTSGNVGIGTSSPIAPLTVSSSTTLAAGSPSIVLTGESNTERIQVRAAGAGAGGTSVVLVAASRGTVASPTAIQSGDALGYYQFGGYNGTTWARGAWVSGIADGAYSATNTGSYLVFATTPTGSTTIAERARITSAGGVSFGSSGTAYGTSGQVLTSAGNAPPTWTTATSANTASAIVQRDASGNFTAGTITAALTGNVTGNVSGSSGSTTGNAATVTNGLYTTGGQTIAARTVQQGSQTASMATATGSLGGLEMTSAGASAAAFMTFHRPGAFAGYFGLDTDNVLKVGGWSFGGVAYPISYPTSTYAPGTAPTYSPRAWVNFNGTGTPAVRASGNVSSITDNGVGNYTVNFSTALSDANYSAVASVTSLGSVNSSTNCVDVFASAGGTRVDPTSSAFRLFVFHPGNQVAQDAVYVTAAAFR